MSARCHLTPWWQCPTALPASPDQQSSAFRRQLKAVPHLQHKAAGWIWGQRALRSLGGGGARCHRSAVPVRREGTGGCGFKELLSLFHVSQGFYLLGYLFALKRGGGKISFSCQAQHFPFRACPPPPLRDPHHPHPLPTKGTLPGYYSSPPLPPPRPISLPITDLKPLGVPASCNAT